jgi:hypothetical protein
MIHTSVNNIDYYIETCSKKVNGVSVDLTPYWNAMGTGAIDAWRLYMQIAGIPSVIAKIGVEEKINIENYFGGAVNTMTFTKVEVSDEDREALGIEGEPAVRNGKLVIKCTKVGSAKISITAIAGGDTVADSGTMGSMEFTREVSVLAREYGASKNGGWL